MSAVLRQGIRHYGVSAASGESPRPLAGGGDEGVRACLTPCQHAQALILAGQPLHLQEGLVRCSASRKSPAPMPLRVSAAAISCSMAARSAAGMLSGALQQRVGRALSGP